MLIRNKTGQYLILFLTIFVFVGAFSYFRYDDYVEKTSEIAEQSNLSTSAQITAQVSDVRRRVSLFTVEHLDRLRELADFPYFPTGYARLQRDLKRHFPTYFAVTIADESGVALLEGHDHFVGEECREDIVKFTKNPDNQDIYLHSSKANTSHHYDMMVPLEYEPGKTGTFFVSFRTSDIVTVLSDMSVKGYRQYLLLDLTEGADTAAAVSSGVGKIGDRESYTIEISADGPRGTISRDAFLTPAEWSSVLAVRYVPQTRWVLATLPEPNLLSAAMRRIAIEGAIVGGVLLVLAALLLHRMGMVNTLSLASAELERRVREQTQALRSEISQRELAQNALEESNNTLEKRVAERTNDLAEREAALRESEGRFRDFAQSSGDWLWELDEELRFTYVSPNMERITGIPAEIYIGRNREELLGDDYDRALWDPHLEVLRSHRAFRNFENSKPGDGKRTKWLSASGTPIFDDAGNFLGYRGTTADITERMEAQEQLHQAQKMEVIGQLTGGVAHDFNNLLGIIVGNLDLLDEELGEDPEKHAYVSAALHAALRGGELTSRLLAYSRRQALRPETIDLNELVPEVARLLERSLGASVTIEPVLAEALWPTRLDKAQLETAVINLAVNARQAMSNGGQLRIETRNVEFSWTDPDWPRERMPGRYVLLSVSDTGSGMSPEVCERAFEPFFTTKEVGQGSGLGLSMVYGFVNQSGGHVAIRSEENAGTTVDLYFPAAGAAIEAEEEDGANAGALPIGAGQTVLVVEDIENLRSLAVTMVKGLGYHVIEAADGLAALAVLEGPEKVDLLFTDILLPGGIDGLKLAEMARARCTDLKVLYTTGYTRNFAEAGPFAELDVVFKPYRREILASRLAHALQEAPGSGRGALAQ